MLRITVTSHNAIPLDQVISAEFGDAGGTIGRAPVSTLVLPDPDRIISRAHALVSLREGAFFVRDQGTTVPVIVNGQPVGQGREARLATGDEVRIGGYAMRVEHFGVTQPDDEATMDSTATIELREGTLLSWDDGGVVPVADRIETVIIPSPEGEALPPPSSLHAAPTGVAGSGPVPAPVATAHAPVANRAAGEQSATDLQRALLVGAGVPDLPLPNGLTPEFMEELGQVIRETLRGLLDLLAARATAKREARADATIIVAQDNNPLKFSPDLDAAIAHLLLPRGQGFMPPLQALADAHESLRSHQVGFVAGMRAALGAVVARFDPAKLEARLAAPSFADSLLPMNHKAKLWNLYEQLYDEISREAKTDFHRLFGEEFLRAYQAKIAARRTPGNMGATS